MCVASPGKIIEINGDTAVVDYSGNKTNAALGIVDAKIGDWAQASLGIRRSPLGDTATVPTFGPSGRQERLNCCAKNRRIKVLSHFRMISSSYSPAKACFAR